MRRRRRPLSPGETLRLDAVEDGVARLLAGPGEGRLVHLPAERLPEGARDGCRLAVQDDGSLALIDDGEGKRQEVADLMRELLGEG